MSTFKLEKYIDPENASTGDVEQQADPQVREIKISRLDQRPLTGVIAEALISTLRQDDIDLVEFNNGEEGVLKDIRVVSLEDLSNSLSESTTFALGADVIVLDRINGDSPEQSMFLNNIEDKEYYPDIVSFGERGIPKIMQMEIPNLSVGLEDHGGESSVDDEFFEFGGKKYSVVTEVDGVLVAKEVVDAAEVVNIETETAVTTNENGEEGNPEDGDGTNED